MENRHVLLVVIVVVALMLGFVFMPSLFRQPAAPIHQTSILGVPVQSVPSFDDVQSSRNLALRSTEDPAATTCNFELAALSNPDRRGLIVTIERGAQEVYIGKEEIFIRGQTDEEVLASCHAYACLLRGISCPDDLFTVRDIFWEAENLTVIAEANLSAAGTRGYAELLGLFGYVQSSRLDANGDGIIDSFEKKQADVTIRPYLASYGMCTLQEIRNIYQEGTATNESVSCNISPAIYLVESEDDRIVVEDDGRVLLYGRGQNLFSEAVIVRDVISPEYIRAVYGMR